jgi:hypothetical protein
MNRVSVTDFAWGTKDPFWRRWSEHRGEGEEKEGSYGVHALPHLEVAHPQNGQE